MKDAGVNVDDVCALTWDSIIIDGNTVILKIVREKYTGGTHNYSHPLIPFASELIVQWHDYYVKVAGKKDFGKMYIIANPTDPFTAIKTTAMTDFVRKELKNMGIDRVNIDSPDKANSRGGAGAKLLSDHYENVLEKEYGIEKGSGLSLFLRGEEIKETTTDFYRGLTGPEGIYCIQTLFNRDDRFSKRQDVNLDDEIKITESDAGCQAIFAADGPGRMTGAIGELCVDAGEEIKIYAPHGIKGLIKARVCESDASEGLDIPLVEV